MDLSAVDLNLVGYLVSLGCGVIIGYLGPKRLRKLRKYTKIAAKTSESIAKTLKDVSEALEDGEITPDEVVTVLKDVIDGFEKEE